MIAEAAVSVEKHDNQSKPWNLTVSTNKQPVQAETSGDAAEIGDADYRAGGDNPTQETLGY